MNRLKTNTLKSLILLLALAFIALPLMTGQAQDGITAVLVVEPTQYTVGDPVPLTLQVTHPAGYRLIPVHLEEAWGEVEVRDISPPQVVVNADGSETSTQTIAVTMWAPGEYSTPELPVAISDTAGDVHQISAAGATMNVVSVLVEGDSELRDIKPQAELPLPPIWPWVVGGLFLTGIVTAVSFWMLRRWRAKRMKALAEAPDLRLPHEVALDELERIEKLELPLKGRYKEHYTMASDVLRQYMEKTLRFPTLDRTTGEIRRSLKHTSLSQADKTDLVRLLVDADLVKFAKMRPELELAQTYIPRVRHAVAVTTPPETTVTDGNGHKPDEISPQGKISPLMETHG